MAKKTNTYAKKAVDKKPSSANILSHEVKAWIVKDISKMSIPDGVVKIFNEHMKTLDKYDVYSSLRQLHTVVSFKDESHYKAGTIVKIKSVLTGRHIVNIHINLTQMKISYSTRYSDNNQGLPIGFHASFWLLFIGEMKKAGYKRVNDVVNFTNSNYDSDDSDDN